jgi:hypothetical protein
VRSPLAVTNSFTSSTKHLAEACSSLAELTVLYVVDHMGIAGVTLEVRHSPKS